ncbi:amidohydrolase family protein [Temperatibacter marinus]|uniref:Amidohydrolase family protein n=1 Tax=Temperatibacter marinus TaxID=1456591 RepID=A0AA52H9K9_9PROT|nr:amidohydrolase family protein [Temperatibacter marinus]WND03024.1 amidohydrolase family protein [Temperatibacter marinus]
MSLLANIKIIDAHHHLWDLDAVDYPWLNARGVQRFFGDPTPIQKNYYPENLSADAAPLKLEKSVHIQVGAQDSMQESQWIQSIDGSVPSAHIAEAALHSGNIAHTLQNFSLLSKIRGVRQIIGRHPVEDAKTGTDMLLTDPQWQKGLKILESSGLSFDLQLIAGQYERAHAALEKVPDLKVAICHFGSPWEMDNNAFQNWETSMERFATLPNVMIKLSGFSMFKPTWVKKDLAHYIQSALKIFGPKRCMFGSNFPVDGLHRSYQEIIETTADLVSKYDASSLPLVFAENAQSFYRL